MLEEVSSRRNSQLLGNRWSLSARVAKNGTQACGEVDDGGRSKREVVERSDVEDSTMVSIRSHRMLR